MFSEHEIKWGLRETATADISCGQTECASGNTHRFTLSAAGSNIGGRMSMAGGFSVLLFDAPILKRGSQGDNNKWEHDSPSPGSFLDEREHRENRSKGTTFDELEVGAVQDDSWTDCSTAFGSLRGHGLCVVGATTERQTRGLALRPCNPSLHHMHHSLRPFQNAMRTFCVGARMNPCIPQYTSVAWQKHPSAVHLPDFAPEGCSPHLELFGLLK